MRIVFAIAITAGVALGVVVPSATASADPLVTLASNTTPPVDNEFIPEERNLTDCIGVLQRPGCGSEARGGWRQTAIFVAVLGGLAIVFWRVRANVIKNRQHLTP